VELVGGAHPPRGLARPRQSLQVVLALFVLRELDSVVIQSPIRHREDDRKHIAPEFLAHALIEHFGCVRLAHAISDDVVKNSGNDRRLVTPIAGEDDRDVRGMGQIRQTRAFPHLSVVMLRRERQRVIDLV